MIKKLKVSIFTGNRAEYGLLSPIIKKISQSKKIDENIIISGSHLDKKYGLTSKEIFNDNIKKIYKLKVKLRKNNLVEFTPLSMFSFPKEGPIISDSIISAEAGSLPALKTLAKSIASFKEN